MYVLLFIHGTLGGARRLAYPRVRPYIASPAVPARIYAIILLILHRGFSPLYRVLGLLPQDRFLRRPYPYSPSREIRLLFFCPDRRRRAYIIIHTSAHEHLLLLLRIYYVDDTAARMPSVREIQQRGSEPFPFASHYTFMSWIYIYIYILYV